MGQVSDTANAGLTGATATIANRETGATRTARTDNAGRFDFPQLKPGLYSIRSESRVSNPTE